jgi:hypothetical protein
VIATIVLAIDRFFGCRFLEPISRAAVGAVRHAARCRTGSRGVGSDDLELEFEVWRAGSVRGLRELGSENAKLKWLLADAMLDQAALKDLPPSAASPA